MAAQLNAASTDGPIFIEKDESTKEDKAETPSEAQPQKPAEAVP